MDASLYSDPAREDELLSEVRRRIEFKLAPTPGKKCGWMLGKTGMFGFYNEDGTLDQIWTPDGRWLRLPSYGPPEKPQPEMSEDEFRAFCVQSAHEEADAVGDKKGKCYFIGGEVGYIKIGYSIDPIARLRSIQASSPIKLSILALASGGPFRESAYHQQFYEFRQHGEWFERCPEILAEITRLSEGSQS